VEAALTGGFSRAKQPRNNLEFVRLKVFDRGFNTIKGVRLLLKHDCWELAAALDARLRVAMPSLMGSDCRLDEDSR
jgi:hypothetical protein